MEGEMGERLKEGVWSMTRCVWYMALLEMEREINVWNQTPGVIDFLYKSLMSGVVGIYNNVGA